MRKKMIWEPRPGTWNSAYCFDPEPHFKYHGTQRQKQKESGEDLVETMSLQGSCFMVSRDKYWELNLCDEEFGSWGSQGIEVAVKTWLSGGRVLCNHNTWYAHMFRTQGGDFGFPYPISGQQVQFAKSHAKELFLEGKWNKAKRPPPEFQSNQVHRRFQFDPLGGPFQAKQTCILVPIPR
jgi:hypothetical protein